MKNHGKSSLILSTRYGDDIYHIMKLTIDNLRRLINEVIKENLAEEKKKKKSTPKDQDHDGDKDFADVAYARMKAGGLSDEEALKKSRKFN